MGNALKNYLIPPSPFCNRTACPWYEMHSHIINIIRSSATPSYVVLLRSGMVYLPPWSQPHTTLGPSKRHFCLGTCKSILCYVSDNPASKSFGQIQHYLLHSDSTDSVACSSLHEQLCQPSTLRFLVRKL